MARSCILAVAVCALLVVCALLPQAHAEETHTEEGRSQEHAILHYCDEYCPTQNETHLTSYDVQAIIQKIHTVAESRAEHAAEEAHDEHHDEEHDHGHHEESGTYQPACWNGTDILLQVDAPFITDENLHSAAPYMLAAALNATTNCSAPIVNVFLSLVPEEELAEHHGNESQLILAATLEVYTRLGLEPIKHLEHHNEEEGDEHAHAEEEEEHHDSHDHDHATTTATPAHEHEEEHEHHEEEEHEEKRAMCVPVAELVRNATAEATTLEERVAVIATNILAMALDTHCSLPLPMNHTAFVHYMFTAHAGGDGLMSATEMDVIYQSIGLTAETSQTADEHDHGHEDRRRRDETVTTNMTSTSAVPCLTPLDLAAAFGFNLPVTESEFSQLTVGLVAMADSGVCTSQSTATESPASSSNTTTAEKWGYMVIAVMLTCLASLSGAALIIVIRRAKQKNACEAESVHLKIHSLNNSLLIFLMSLAVAALLGDAILHLIPHALGLHGGGDDGDEHDHGSDFTFLWKSCAVLLAFYAFFVLELAIAKIIGVTAHEHHQGGHHNQSPHSSPTPCRKAVKNGADDSKDVELDTMNGSPHTEQKKGSEAERIAKKTGATSKEESHLHHHHHGVGKSTGWLILLGDGAHNFVDGLAIGSAFSASLSLGISTTLAIVLHEIPHEIGDFAVLLDAGFSVRRALFFNFLSSLTAVLGGVIGVAASATAEAQQWFLALAAGFFLYISLSDIVPHVQRHVVGAKSFTTALLLMHAGLAIGFLAMILLARYEEGIAV